MASRVVCNYYFLVCNYYTKETQYISQTGKVFHPEIYKCPSTHRTLHTSYQGTSNLLGAELQGYSLLGEKLFYKGRTLELKKETKTAFHSAHREQKRNLRIGCACGNWAESSVLVVWGKSLSREVTCSETKPPSFVLVLVLHLEVFRAYSWICA